MNSRRTGWTAAAAAVLLLLCGGPVSAEGYMYNVNGKPVVAPSAAEPYRVLDGSDTGLTFSSPSDVVVGKDLVYILDRGNNRVVLYDRQLRFVRSLDRFLWQGEESPLSSPEGLFVTGDGLLYVADTGNARVVVADGEGTIQRILGDPDKTMLSGMDYQPVKLAVDGAGRVFVVSRNFNAGLLEFDRDGGFVRTMGATKAVVTAMELLVRAISTRAQIDRTSSFVPTEYNNVAVDKDGFLFATSAAYENSAQQQESFQPVYKLSAGGNDVLLRHDVYQSKGDLAVASGGSYTGPTMFGDVCVNEYGEYSLLDTKRGRVFTYSPSGELLYIFGGPGEFDGGMIAPSALALLEDQILVSDTSKGTVTVYRLTDYARAILTAVRLHSEGDYAQEAGAWGEVLRYNSGYQQAYVGLGRAAYQMDDTETAMAYFKLAGDRENYSAAFANQRRKSIQNGLAWFVPLALAGLLLLRILYVAVRRRRRRERVYDYGDAVGFGFTALGRPMRSFWAMRFEGEGRLSGSMTILGAAVTAWVLARQFTGFIFSPGTGTNINLIAETAKILLPFFLWCVCNWCVTSLMQGEGRFRDILMAAGYSLLPLCLTQLLGLLLSRVFTAAEMDFYQFVLALGYLWTGVQLLLSSKQIHDYSLGRTLFVTLITLLVMAIVVITGVMVLILSQQMLSFVLELKNEITLLLS